MPRKKNKRKEMQSAKMANQPKPRRVGIIAHTPYGRSSVALAMAIAAMTPSMVAVEMLDRKKEPNDG
tara:strand:- start:216 stop:416 length:201 start_codon:yes stop_codon:yes gene_type:complete